MLRVGVFGVGHLGKFHLNNWKSIKGITIAGFFDPSDTISAEVAKEYGIKRFEKADKLMDECDIVDIAAPTTYHFDICKTAILKSKHVFADGFTCVYAINLLLNQSYFSIKNFRTGK